MRRMTFCAAAGVLVVLMVSNLAAAATTLATVQVNEPSEYRDWTQLSQIADAEGGTGPTAYWRTIPSFIDSASLDFSYLRTDPAKTDAIQYGKLDFTVQSSGPVWMLTTTRFGGGGNSSGNWLSEVSYQADLETAGWSVIADGIVNEYGYGAAGTNTNFIDWILFERQSTAGEVFSIRTEKYQSPLILQGVGSVPEPAAGAGALLLSCALLQRQRAMRSA